jgi:hypothetical protein
MNNITQYLKIRNQLQPGDVIAFSGRAVISKLIEFYTNSAVTHVAMVQCAGGIDDDVAITQSTIENGQNGVQSEPLGEVLATYGDGSLAWWLPLDDDIRAAINWTKYYQFIEKATGNIKYDIPGLFGFLGRQIPILGAYICQSETMKRMFCDGYAVALFEDAGVLRGINWSQFSPQQFISMAGMFKPYVQIMGKPKPLKGFGTIGKPVF